MATREAEALDRTFAALADPTRRAMVERLAKGGRLAISDLAAPFSMSLPAVLKHVGVLTDAGLVSRVKVGRTVFCGLLAAPLGMALSWLGKYEGYKAPADSEAAAAGAAKLRAPQKTPAGARSKGSSAKPAKKTSPRAAAQAPSRGRAQPVAAKAKTAAAGQRATRVVPAPRRRGSVKSPTARGRPRR